MTRLPAALAVLLPPATVFAAAGAFTAPDFERPPAAASGSAESASAEPFPVIGSVGFVWTAPQTARCAPVTPAAFKNFKSCRFSETGAFGLPTAFHTCKPRQGGEWLVFRSMKECREALEAMQANAP